LEYTLSSSGGAVSRSIPTEESERDSLFAFGTLSIDRAKRRKCIVLGEKGLYEHKWKRWIAVRRPSLGPILPFREDLALFNRIVSTRCIEQGGYVSFAGAYGKNSASAANSRARILLTRRDHREWRGLHEDSYRAASEMCVRWTNFGHLQKRGGPRSCIPPSHQGDQEVWHR